MDLPFTLYLPPHSSTETLFLTYNSPSPGHDTYPLSSVQQQNPGSNL